MSVILHSPDFWKIAAPALIAVAIAFASHQLGLSRQLAEQRRKQRIEYLISSFKALMMFSNNQNRDEGAKNLRDAAISIQFLGKPKQVDLMRDIIDRLSSRRDVDLDVLLFSLRDDIRLELKIEPVTGPVYWTHPNL